MSPGSDALLVRPGDVYGAAAGEARFRVLDVRAPVEVARGALPNSVNLPILADEERHRVGIAYKESGQAAAVELGKELTRDSMPGRIERWRQVAVDNPTAIACWRGGMRSQLAQSYLGEPSVPRVEGGYKALRAHLMESLEDSVARHRLLVVGGMTGTGKTDLIEKVAASSGGPSGVLALDLEALAHHRGSAFGALGKQPAQQTFENEIAARLLLDPGELLLVEDESRRIGRLQLPEALFAPMTSAPVLLLEAPFADRVARIHRQYVLEPALEWGADVTIANLREAVGRLRRRLGGALVEQLQEVLDRTLSAGSWHQAGELEPFIGPLLSEYYDPLYLRSVDRLQREVVLRGDHEELTSWISRQL